MLGFNYPERTLNVTGTITLTSGTVIDIDAQSIVNYSISERIASNGFALGETQSTAYTLEIDNTEHKLKASDLEGAIVRCEISMVRGISISIPVPFGVWQVTSANALEQSVTISMSGGDALEFNFDAKFLKIDQLAAANANSTHVSLLQYVCDKAGVTLSTTEFLHSTVKLTGDEKWPDDVTLRDVVSYIAAAAGGFARIARDGNLEIVGYGNTQNVGTITPDTYITLDEGDGSAFDFRQLSVKYVDKDNYAYYPITPLIAKSGNTLQVVDNPLFNYNIMVTVATDLSAMKSEPTRMEWIGDPLLRLGDTVTIVDMSNNERKIIVNSQTITYDGGMYAITQCQLPKRNEQSSGFKPTHWMSIVNKGDSDDGDTTLQPMPTYKGVWDSAVAYSMLDVVSSADKHSVYMALCDVPAGIELDNSTYWGEMVDVSDGVISNIMYVGNVNDGGANTLEIIMGDGTTKEFSVYNGKKGSPGTPGKSITIESVAMSEASGGNNVVTFSDGTTMTVKNGNDGNDGAAGKRGLSVFRITSGPSAYTTPTPNGFTPKYRVALSTVKTQGKTDDVVIGDTVIYSYYTYPVGYVDANYVYLGTRVSIRGSTGATGKTAYQYAQDGGYTGTETEFAEKLANEYNPNPLHGKKVSFLGDSICAGSNETYLGGYGKIIADRNSMVYENVAHGGATITAETYSRSTGAAKPWLCRMITNMSADADYAIIEGGINDGWDETVRGKIGAITTGYDATLDDTTYYGAFESMLKQLVTKFQGKKIGYIAVPKIHSLFDSSQNAPNFYHIALECCAKWGVPVCDLNTITPPVEYISDLGSEYTADGTHPTYEGYLKYYCDPIEAWMKTLTTGASVSTNSAALSGHNTDTNAHSDIRALITALQNGKLSNEGVSFKRAKLPLADGTTIEIDVLTAVNGTLIIPYINQVPISIDTNGSVFNSTGYQKGYRLSSSGATKTQDGSYVTGYIPAKKGDVIRIFGCGWGTTLNSNNYICAYNSNFGYVGGAATIVGSTFSLQDYTATIVNNYSRDADCNTTMTLCADDIAYIRVNSKGNQTGSEYLYDPKNMIVTVNEEIN